MSSKKFNPADLDTLPQLITRSVDSFGTETWVFFYLGREVKLMNDEGSHVSLKTAIMQVMSTNNGDRK